MAGESSDSAPGARGEQPREPGAFCVQVSNGEPLTVQTQEQVDFAPREGAISFRLGADADSEVLRLEPGGKSYVYGKLVEDDCEATVWHAFQEFLALAKAQL